MKKSTLITIIVVFFLGLFIAVGIYSYTHNDRTRYLKQIEIAEKYLAEMDYEQAIIEFKRAIEIDPLNTTAYIKLADIYISQDMWEEARNILLEGTAYTDSSELREKLSEIEEHFEKIRKEKEEEEKRRQEEALAEDLNENNNEMLTEYIDSIVICGVTLDEILDMSISEVGDLATEYAGIDEDGNDRRTSYGADIMTEHIDSRYRGSVLFIDVEGGISTKCVNVVDGAGYKGYYKQYVKMPDFFPSFDFSEEYIEKVIDWCERNNLEYDTWGEYTDPDSNGYMGSKVVQVRSKKYTIMFDHYKYADDEFSGIEMQINENK